MTSPGTGGTSVAESPLLFFFFRRRRELMSLEKPLEPAFAELSPPCVFGRSLESIEERPLLRPELSIASDSVDTVQARRDLLPLPFRLDDSESAMLSKARSIRPGRAEVREWGVAGQTTAWG